MSCDIAIGVLLLQNDPHMLGIAAQHVVVRAALLVFSTCRTEVELVAHVVAFQHLPVKDVASAEATHGYLTRRNTAPEDLIRIGGL